MRDGSPAWKPQAMLADVMMFINSRSGPPFQAPKPSPTSLLRSTDRDMVLASHDLGDLCVGQSLEASPAVRSSKDGDFEVVGAQRPICSTQRRGTRFDSFC